MHFSQNILLFLLLLSPFFSFAQAKIDFDEKRHNFGTLAEGPAASFVFSFTNSGDAPLVLSDVKASCGCTTPRWTAQPIAPGETGEIEVKYATKGRPGRFTKTVQVFTNAAEPLQLLYIEGEVAPKNAPPKKPAFHLPSDSVYVGSVVAGTRTPVKVQIENKGEEAMILRSAWSACNCVQLAKPIWVAAGATAEAELLLNLTHVSDQKQVLQVMLDTNDPKSISQMLSLHLNKVAAAGQSLMKPKPVGW